ncbi:hypothetical protein Poli38472_013057 [Pythium oligandrum]|uniref:PDEase domain-containing protein n=1 Tax=Pythium oligandrum TaxID=41045 RepID=A0A8K1CJK2_PYTOL|nr:hypothetical protein Poli38472_013057 [Pythium oligandrum]|eukprot:TMW64435.1 hypothetical protein Poli38472_013057 [Pythium oligandrum]
MSRLSRLGCDTPVYFPSIVGKMGDEKKFTPVPPQKPVKHAKKVHANDYRVHLEPLKPLKGLSAPNLSSEQLPALDRKTSLTNSGPLELISPLVTDREGSSSARDPLDIKKLHFYQQLANLRLRDVVASEERLLKTIDALLLSMADLLNADWAVLYSLDEQSRTLNVTACTRPNVTGFEVPLDKFAMEMVVANAIDAESERSYAPNSSMYVENVQALSTYDRTYDVDGRTGKQTTSVLASVIVDERGKPIFVVEARSQSVTAFPTSIFAATITTLENIVYQYDLNQVMARTSEAYHRLDEFLCATAHPPLVAEREIFAKKLDEDENDDEMTDEEDDDETDEQREAEREWLVSPDLTELTHKILLQSRTDAICLLEFHSKKVCQVLSSAQLATKTNSGQTIISELPSDVLKGLRKIAIGDNEGDSARSSLFHQLVGSINVCEPLVLSDNSVLTSIFASFGVQTVVFLPQPQSMASSTGLLCISRNQQHLFDLPSLKPFLSSLAIAVMLKKKNDDMSRSATQKNKLITLFNSHFQVENINDPSALVNMICDIGQSIFHTKRVTLYVADPIKSELWSLSTLGSVNGIRIPYGKGIAGTVASSKETLIVLNPYEDPRFDRSFDLKSGFKTESLITLPILDKNGETLGVIQAVNARNFMDSTAHPLIRKFDTKVLGVYSHLVSHALRINSSLIMFAKVQADYWANRVVMDIHDEEDGNAKHDVASVHSLLDISGFDEGKRVPRNKWSTFAYTCWAFAKFLAKCYRKRRHDRARLEAAATGNLSLTDADIELSEEEERQQRRSRSRSSIMRVGRTSSLVSRWRRMAMRPTEMQNELLSNDFDALSKTLDELKLYAYQLFEGLLLVSTFRIDLVSLHRFIDTLVKRYRIVPYHSFYHGFDVAHSSYRLIRESSVLNIIKEFEALCLIIAALGHDADHPGNDNQFEIDSGSQLAMCYNDISVLENHHAAMTFAVLRSPGCDILQDLSTSMKVSVRTTIIRCILATDMKHHSKLLNELSVVSKVEDFEAVTDGRQLMLNMIIHGSDLVGSVAKPLPFAKKWVDRVCEEFTMQAKRSEEMGVFVPPHIMNLEEESARYRLQVNFIDYLVAPLWNIITGILPEAKRYIDDLRANRDYFFEHAGQMSARRATSMPQH